MKRNSSNWLIEYHERMLNDPEARHKRDGYVAWRNLHERNECYEYLTKKLGEEPVEILLDYAIEYEYTTMVDYEEDLALGFCTLSQYYEYYDHLALVEIRQLIVLLSHKNKIYLANDQLKDLGHQFFIDPLTRSLVVAEFMRFFPKALELLEKIRYPSGTLLTSKKQNITTLMFNY